MSDLTEVTGIVLSVMPVGEYDRRVVLLTKERGKISAFANGARRMNSPLVGVTRVFAFGTFQIYEGRSTCVIKQANIKNYFENVVMDLDAVYYACYFAELADYYGRENIDGSQIIQLMYAALKALGNSKLDNRLVKIIYELRIIAVNGENPDFFVCCLCDLSTELDTFSPDVNGMYCRKCHSRAANGIMLNESAVYTLQYIVTAPIEKLFTFVVSDEVLVQLETLMCSVCDKTFDREFKSLDALSELTQCEKSR